MAKKKNIPGWKKELQDKQTFQDRRSVDTTGSLPAIRHPVGSAGADQILRVTKVSIAECNALTAVD